MKKINFIAITLILFTCFGQTFAQKRKKVSTPKKTEAVVTSRDVKIRQDEFSGKREVRLVEQVIASGVTLQLSENVDLDEPAKTPQQWLSEYVGIKFTFDYGIANFVSGEFNFIVDGKRVKGGDVSHSDGSLSDQLNQREFFNGVISVGNLEKIASGSEVEMKLGNKVYTIDASTRKNFKAFVAALKRK